MNLDEAIAVYLYLMHNHTRTPKENKAFSEAWGVIMLYAEQTLRRVHS